MLLAALAASLPVASAYIASSSNYRIQTDSVNVGGILSTSTSYRAEDTLGEEGVGTSSSATYNIKAGYQQMQQTYLAITASPNVTLSPNILSLGGGVANGVATWTVTTDNAAGYTMNIRSTSSPALVSGANNFADYVPAGVDPDFTFTTPAAGNRFGFSAPAVVLRVCPGTPGRDPGQWQRRDSLGSDDGRSGLLAGDLLELAQADVGLRVWS